MRLAMRRLRRNKIAITGAIILGLLYFLAIFAGFFSPYSPTQDEFRDSFYHPPTPLCFRDEKGFFHLRPSVVATHLVDRSKVLYAAGTPLYVVYRAPEANINRYIPDILRSTTPILSVLDDQGKTVATIHNMLETSRDSGVFSAIVSPTNLQQSSGETLTIRSLSGDSTTFPIVSTEPLLVTETHSTIRLTNAKGEFVQAYFPNMERYPVEFLVRGWKYRVLGIFQSDLHLFGVKNPGRIFLFGTDQSGRDIFSRILYGAQISLSIGLVGVLLTTIFGSIYGSVAGYYGGSLDHWMMRLAEVLLSIPALYLILALRNIIPERMQDLYDRISQLGHQTFAWHDQPLLYAAVLLLSLLFLSYYSYRNNWRRNSLLLSASFLLFLIFGRYLLSPFLAILEFLIPGSTYITSAWTYLLIIMILSAVGWAGMSRVIRGMVLSLREQEYVVSARALGATDFRILSRHILPNTMGYIIVRATLLIPAYILGEVALSFLGVGVQEPVASWGNMLSSSQSLRVLQQFTWSLAPGFFLFLTVLAYNFLGDGLRDALDPKTVR